MESTNTQACDRCHRRKTRCDKRRPTCSGCEKANAPCAYSARPKEPVYRRDYVERLEKRARQLENNNQAPDERLPFTSQVLSPASQAQDVAGTADHLHEAANEGSLLSTHAGGDRQFPGSASGLQLASLVRASTQQQTDAVGSAQESRSSREPDWSTDHKALPPRQLAKSLIDAYLAHDALCYPIVHPKQVAIALEAAYAEPRSSSLKPFQAFTFNMILAIATAQVYKFNWQVLPDAETHHQRAMAHMELVLSAGGLHGLQAILLCCQFRLSSSTKDSSSGLWHMVGIATRMCFELGLHREFTYSSQHETERKSEETHLSISEVLMIYRQCFWCVFCLDRVVSITLGRPLAVHLEDIDVNLPLLSPEEDVLSPQSHDSAESLGLAPSYRIAAFAHTIRYRALCGKMLTSLHRGNGLTTSSLNERISKRKELVAELEGWRSDTAALRLPDMDLSSPLAEAQSIFRSNVWYELLYQNGILLLYRPAPSNASSETQAEDESVLSIHAAAKRSITLYGYLFKSRKIEYSWITLHSVFLAGLSYIYAVGQHLRERLKRRNGVGRGSPRPLLPQDPTILDIVNDTRACSNVLLAVAERCNAPKNSHEVFDRLSDAVLADAVNLYTNSPQMQPGSQCAIPAAEEAHPSHQFQPAGVQSSGLDPRLAVDITLVDCIPDLRLMSDTCWGHDAIYQLSMNWLDGLDVTNDFDTAMSGPDLSYSGNA
ncbi:uncharacterized protein M421DRAFT_96647 [Didymella exigua CBS 183.55]|uniref:Zn(2)-C6 fungal-type domain-containing protein n=1 Tax=Didymella exigua CBS 183.55 TaxID=1150837 RepID=A0A6A5R7H2_9PLEO|nr:uncharacterized protein M421DRAFT_96647 [Didymella exigua CBS 183.55]KAF1922656.1 hypothetical protein M421DRAFT_96647 [Didymella exigua CBS 183.55]